MTNNSYGIKENTRYKNDQGDRVVLVTKIGGSPLMVDYVQNGQSLQMRAWAFKKEFGKMVTPPRKKGGRPKKPASKRRVQVSHSLYPAEIQMIRQMAALDGGVSQAVRASVIERYNRLRTKRMKRVIISTSLIIGEGTFTSKIISLSQAKEWLKKGEFRNYCGHESVRLLGLEPNKERLTTGPYDEAVCIKAKERLEFGREYSVKEIEEIGYEIMLIKREESYA